jgi:hypothetical protein
VDAVHARSAGTAPISTPTSTPAATAMVSPTAHAVSVCPTATQNAEVTASSARAARMRLLGGR